jgi:hypothetical protein
MSDRWTLAEEMSDGWIRPHDTYADGISTTDHVRSVIESEEETAGDWREAVDAAAWAEMLTRVTVSGVGGPFADGGAALVTFPDGSRLTFHAWADGNASGWWWLGHGEADMPAHVAGEIAAEAAERLAFAEEGVRVVVATGVVGHEDAARVRASIGAAARDYGRAWEDAERYGALAPGAVALAVALDVIGDAVAEGLRRRDAARA